MSEILIREIEKIREIVEEGACIVVEGKRDEAALRKLGIDARYYHVSGSGKSMHMLAEQISKEREAIILTDFDKKGGSIAAKLATLLNEAPQKTRINLDIRRNLMNAMKEIKISGVEDLASLVEKIDLRGGHFHGKNRSSSNKIHNIRKTPRQRRGRTARRGRRDFWADGRPAR
jgi:5S rRNA maturation endonuclease (ribonuclease M5)